MKHHITIEQLSELSEEGKQKLREWWKPSVGDLFYDPELKEVYDYEEQRKTGVLFNYDFQPFEVEENEDVPSRGEDWNELTANRKTMLPLLSVGQMMEFLSREQIFDAIIDGDGDIYWVIDKEGICDALWKRIRQSL